MKEKKRKYFESANFLSCGDRRELGISYSSFCEMEILFVFFLRTSGAFPLFYISRGLKRAFAALLRGLDDLALFIWRGQIFLQSSFVRDARFSVGKLIWLGNKKSESIEP